MGWTPDLDNLNPFVGIDQTCYELYHVSYDFLTDYGDKYLETQPGLAESWTKSEDGLTWTFKIRQGVKWSDGQPLTAADVAFSYNYQKKLELTAFLSRARRHQEGHGARRHDRGHHVRAAQGRHPLDVGAASCPSTSGASSRPTTRRPST